MSRGIRVAAVVYATVAAVLAIGFAFQLSWATSLWPWPDGRLSYIFIGSIFAAIAGSIVGFVIVDEPAGAQGLALDTLVVAGAGAVHFFRLHNERGGVHLLGAAIAMVLAVLIFGEITLWSLRFPFRDRASMPVPIRISFAVFAVVLILVGSALILQAAHIFPWPLKPESSVMFGWIFLGAATYFGHAYFRPFRPNAVGQLLAFLAYDVVLIVPFLRHFADVQFSHLMSLIIYTAVIIYSGALALYYLVIDPDMRLINVRDLGGRPKPAV